MEIFNIHIFEFLLIAGLALVIFGPERLPEVGRFLGQQLARFLAWQQNSPELRMLKEVRGEFEREIAELRDELVRTRQQLDVSQDMAALREDLRPMLDLKSSINQPVADGANGGQPTLATGPAEPTIAPPGRAQEAVEAVADTVGELLPDAPPAPRPAAQTVPATAQPNRLAQAQPTAALGTPGPSVGDQPLDLGAPEVPAPVDKRVEYLRSKRDALHNAPEPEVAAEPDSTASAEPLLTEHELLLLRVQALAVELHTLTAELRQRGLIDGAWQQQENAPEQETMTR